VWDPPAGGSAPKVREENPETSEPETPRTGPEKGTDPNSGGGASGGGEERQSVRRGHIENPTGKVMAYLTILPGPSGGFSYGEKNGKTIYDVFIWVQTSDLRTFGPLPIKIKVWNVQKTKSGDWIQFEPDGPYELKKGTNSIEITAKKSWARLRSDR
jgi:hypothetical protein